MRLTTIILALLLTSCVSANITPYALEPVSPQEAQRMIDRATGTAQVEATTIARGKLTQQAADHTIQVTRDQSNFLTAQAHKKELDDLEVKARAFDLTQTTNRITQEAIDRDRAMQKKYQSDQDAVAWGETFRTGVYGLIIVSTLFLSALVVIAILVSKEFIKYKTQRAKDLHEIDLLQRKAQAIIATLRETRAGTGMLNQEMKFVMLPPLQLPPPEGYRTITTPLDYHKILDEGESDAPEIETVIVNSASGARMINKVGAKEDYLRSEMLIWIEHSIAWHNAHPDPKNNEPAHHQLYLKRWDKLKEFDTAWTSDRQTTVRRAFGEVLMTQSGIGTWAADGRKLYELKRDVRLGKVKVHLSDEIKKAMEVLG